jgi:hypothetical protein
LHPDKNQNFFKRFGWTEQIEVVVIFHFNCGTILQKRFVNIMSLKRIKQPKDKNHSGRYPNCLDDLFNSPFFFAIL